MNKLPENNAFVLSPMFEKHKRVEDLPDFADKSSSDLDMKRSVKLLWGKLQDKEVFNETQDLLNEKICKWTFSEFSMLNENPRKFIGQGRSSVALCRGSEHRETFEKIARLIPYAFQNRKVISIFHRMEKNKFLRPFDLLSHAIQEIDPDYGKVKSDDFCSEHLEERGLFVHFLIQDFDKLYESTDQEKDRQKVIGDVEYLTNVSLDNRIIFTLLGNEFLGNLLSRRLPVKEYFDKKYPFLKDSFPFNMSKLRAHFL